MIEVIYKGEHKEEKEGESRVILPKNIRQIGEGGKKNRKIYIEDYAVTYMHQLSDEHENHTEKSAAILLGEVQNAGDCRYIFINAALSIESLDFSEEMWDKIHTEIMEYFDGREIVGWYLGEEESTLTVTDEIRHIHEQQFPGDDKVLILRDFTENESSVFATENASLQEQRGYYIYYEKNILMQEYMVARNKGRTVEERTEKKDEAIQNFRKISEEKKETTRQPLATKLLYVASTFLVMTVLVIGITLINNYDKMKNMEVALSGLSDTLAAREKQNKETQDALSAMANMEKQNRTEIGKDVSSEQGANSMTAETEQNHVQMTETQAEDKSSDAALYNESELSQQSEGTKATDTPVQQTNQADVSNQETQQQSATEITKRPSRETLGRASYVVKVGDTLATISEMYYGTLDKVGEICTLNDITDENQIIPGQKIVLP